LTKPNDARELRRRLRRLGLSESAINAAWPTWWSQAADASASAQTELRFSLARKLGLDPRSLIDDDAEPRFVWRDEARFKHLAGEGDIERGALTSFGVALAHLLMAAAPPGRSIAGVDASYLRALLLDTGRPFIALHNVLSLCWSFGIPVVHLRVFPWPQKRMAAMTVRIGERWAILLGKDAMYPASVAFYLAHELGHVALEHVSPGSLVVDLEAESLSATTDDPEEQSADSFALELLTGEKRPEVLSASPHYTAQELARVSLEAGPQLRIEPGTLALCFGFTTHDWRTANAAIQQIYASAKPVWREVNNLAMSQLDFERVADDDSDFLAAVLGKQAFG
jgi:hypothetical protein